MTDQLNQQVSAFVDNELPEEECPLFVRHLCKDDALQSTVSRFALIGDAMRGELLAADVHLSQRIRAAISAESVDSAAASPTKASGWPRWMRPVSGVAVAATVAAVAVLALQGFDNADNTELPSNTVADIADGDGSSLLPVNVLPRLELPDVQPASVIPQSRMDRYLLSHREYVNGFGRQSVLGIRDMGNGTYKLIPVPANTQPPVEKGVSPE